ncbi:MAG TPA: hypothetical protein VEB22_10605, partial [Phycisphaerales bacterium]|nr:hypothetical protein [Phycisphaerales bacterium]
MSDPSSPLPPSSPPPASASPTPAAVPMDPKEVADGKVLAALGYPIWVIALVMLFIRNNAFSLYHAKQMMTLVIIQAGLFVPLFGLFCVFQTAVAAITGAASSGGSGGGFLAM